MKKIEITKYKEVPLIEAGKTDPGDWVLIFGRNKPEGSKTNPRLKGTGASDFDVIESRPEATTQQGNERIRTMNGSIGRRTLVKITKKGSF